MLPIRALSMLRRVFVAMLLPCYVWSFEVLVVDQHGAPVSNAVVSIPEGSITGVDSSPAVMDQVNKRFVPLVLAIPQGQEVIFPNSDNIRHHVYSFSEPKRFEIKLYKGTAKAALPFNEAGVVVLGCNIHDSMIGYIFVSPWPDFRVSDETGRLSFEGTAQQLAVWHPWVEGLSEPMMVDLGADKAEQTRKIILKLKPPKPLINLKEKFRTYRDD